MQNLGTAHAGRSDQLSSWLVTLPFYVCLILIEQYIHGLLNIFILNLVLKRVEKYKHELFSLAMLLKHIGVPYLSLFLFKFIEIDT